MEYNELLENIKNLLSKTDYVVLATASKDGIVSASQMCVVACDTTLFFQTDSSFEKARNIKENPNVAITINNVYFKGKASIIGYAKDNEYFVNKMKEKHYKTYENYTNLNDQILIKVELSECRIWGIWNNIDNYRSEKEEAIKVLDFKNKQLTKIKCNNLKGGY